MFRFPSAREADLNVDLELNRLVVFVERHLHFRDDRIDLFVLFLYDIKVIIDVLVFRLA